MDSVIINGIEYVEKGSSFNADAEYSVVRCKDAGVFVAVVASLAGDIAELEDARRIWYWDGAASLSELAMRGVSKPENCKFPCAVPHMTVTGVIEVIRMTDEAVSSISSVPEWSAND